jgi:hypothetical protein
MNLGEAMTHVLRTKGQTIIHSFWKEDLVSIVGDVISDGTKFLRGGKSKLASFSIKELPGNILEASMEIIDIARVMPGRIKKGLLFFRSEMINELDQRSDAREKAVFSLKVLGVLLSSSAAAFYNMKSAKREISLGKLRIRSALAQFLIAELVLRSFRSFLHRFMTELEKELTEDDDLVQVRYFRKLLETGEEHENSSVTEDDPAFKLVDRLKKIIVDGDDEGEI